MTDDGQWQGSVYQPAVRDNLDSGTRAKVLRRDKRRCAGCKTRKNLTVHHIMPRAKGGGDNLANLVTLCWPCHNEIEPLGLSTRALIEGSLSGRVDADEVAQIDDWHLWVYGGHRRPEPEEWTGPVTGLEAQLARHSRSQGDD